MLKTSPPRIQEAALLAGMVHENKALAAICLRIADGLISHFQAGLAKDLIADIDYTNFFKKSMSVEELNLLLQVLIKTEQAKKAIALLESGDLSERFSSFDDMDIRLQVANMLIIQGQRQAAGKIIKSLDGNAFLRQATSVGKINQLFNALVHTGQATLSFDLRA